MRTLTLVALLTLALGSVYAQDAKNFTDKATRSRGDKSARDPNIKSENTVNKVNPDIPAPRVRAARRVRSTARCTSIIGPI